MAYSIYGFDLGTQLAAADLSAKQYYCGKISDAGIVLCDAQGEICDGVIMNDPLQDQAVTFRTEGVAQVVCSAAIAKGDYVGVTADGKIATASTGDQILGKALEVASADGDIIAVLIARSGVAA